MMGAEICAFWEVLAQEAIGIFIGTPLPRALRVAEVDLYTGIDLEAGMLCHFRALIPGE